MPKLEITEISTNWWMDKQTVLYPYKEILFSNKMEWFMLQHRWASEMLCPVTEVRYRKPHIILSHLYEIARKGKS